jgi:hypothetical protein
MEEFLAIAFMIIEFVVYIIGAYQWFIKNNLLLAIALLCLAIYFKLCKNESLHKLEKQGKL